MREFPSRLGPNGRVLLVGDTRQHQEVEAGRPFEQLQEAGMRTARLDEIVRQQDPALKSAVELLAVGQVSAALDALQQQGRVKEIPSAEERVRTIAKSFVESTENTLIVSPDNASRRLTGFSVYQEIERELSVGDRLQFVLTAVLILLLISTRTLNTMLAFSMIGLATIETMLLKR
jgi:ATP-dependent exoDNAse (exonuclease V) alpha subunit